ncbi:hypothetical protein LGH83_06325 [Lichenihabitans sp. PAMC28606]|uniref:hypothetical protein n=1 Tax=Lichenihabitans sp. PAMC28606 TaxID=2880932 RepID=UPI001D0B83F2|nr:hypothetical protein [Lichenihabitans sp. PAMC28606]UDL95815.1 hypothetical protein LGH83_06325 [Lichenihabitans sp. PAMC28606]
MLLPIEPGHIVNTDHIRSIKEVPATTNRSEHAEIVFTDGTRTIANCRMDDIEWCAGPIIPAPPGYSVIRAFEPEKDVDRGADLVSTMERYAALDPAFLQALGGDRFAKPMFVMIDGEAA